MKYIAIIVMLCCFLLNFMIYSDYRERVSAAGGNPSTETVRTNAADDRPLQAAPAALSGRPMSRPDKYRGIYLHNYSARTATVLKQFVGEAKKNGINCAVLDMQDAVYFRPGEIPAANVRMCLTNGIWPIARIVVFPYGLKEYPVPERFFQERLELAKKAADLGFPEVQFDYIRFEDSGRLSGVSLEKRFQLVEGFLGRARTMLAARGVTVSADIFGRIPLNQNDPIGQRMEGLDKVVDFILPMAYPSHYSWSAFLIANPYATVYRTAVQGKARLKKAGLVMYIQGFEMRVGPSGLSLPAYIAHQIKACDDAGVAGWIVWNAAQSYGPTWAATALLAGGKTVPGLAAAQRAAQLQAVPASGATNRAR